MRFLHWGKLGCGHLPIVLAIIFTSNIGTTYIIAVWRGDVDPLIPYISASGDSRPESCLFSALLNISSALSATIIALRYCLISELTKDSDPMLQRINELSMYLGTTGAFGMFIVANFQETALIKIHLFGAILCFGCGCVYMITQTWISYRIYPIYCGKQIIYIRGILAITSTICFFLALGFGIAAKITYNRYFPDKPRPHPWTDNLPGYTLHCISAVAEWTLAICNISFLVSYSRDFEEILIETRVLSLVSHVAANSPMRNSLIDLSS